jgi:2-methylcitrate synthase
MTKVEEKNGKANNNSKKDGAKSSPDAAGGLSDVLAATSSICSIENGVLRYRGFDVDELVGQVCFEEVVYLLWFGRLPNELELEEIKDGFLDKAFLPEEIIWIISRFCMTSHPISSVRTAVSALALYDPDTDFDTKISNYRKARRLIARLPLIVTAFDRMRAGEEPVAVSPELNLAGNFLYTLTGKMPKPLEVEAFDKCLVMHAEHELNASTFAARVTAATLSDMHSAVTSAIGTLKGPLHGGANQRVMEMLIEIGSIDRVEDYIDKKLKKKEKIMGFGHRVYQNGDPRAVHLKKLSGELSSLKKDSMYFDMSAKIDEIVVSRIGLLPNVDFYSASVYYYLDIPVDLYTPIFACSRIAGWTAHIMEQYSNNKLIRPRAKYIGPKEQHVTPLAER